MHHPNLVERTRSALGHDDRAAGHTPEHDESRATTRSFQSTASPLVHPTFTAMTDCSSIYSWNLRRTLHMTPRSKS